MFNTFMSFLDTPLGFLFGSLFIIGVGIVIYVLSMPLKTTCKCPRQVLWNQDRDEYTQKTYHRADCEYAND